MNYPYLSKKLNLSTKQIQAVDEMASDGATIPFMARYRKEKTGGLDEVQLREVVNSIDNLKEVHKRRDSMLKSLAERELLNDALKSELQNIQELKELEEAYSPYKPKRKTRATAAKELGLEPLAKEVYRQQQRALKPESFIKEGVDNLEAVWAGVRDIMAEWIAETLPLKRRLRELMDRRGSLQSKLIKKKEAEAQKFKDYFEHSELFHRIPSHRLHAILRGQKEGFLRVSLKPEEHEAIQTIQRMIIKGHSPDKKQIEQAIDDAWSRLLHPSLENELIQEGKSKADTEAIDVFAENMKTLLMEAPLGHKKVLAIDPGFRTGCKAVCLDPQGKMLEYKTLFPIGSASQVSEAQTWIRSKVCEHQIQVVAVGNGTAGRETESFAKDLNLGIPVVQVSESGASIYSASEEARKEFPDLDLTIRGAISIGRRLQDPLSELIKIDPKSIGVGQYQHDVDQKALGQRLDLEIESCVNGVGVELNTASAKLLTHISGLGPKLAESIVEYREANGPFSSRKGLLKVPRLGAKAFEQCAGFIRIRHAKNPLDSSAVHPERYALVEKMAKDQNSDVQGLLQSDNIRQNISLKNYVQDDLGLPTLNDIMTELAKPGRDPRPDFEVFQFEEAVQKPEDLREGMELPGIVTNVTKFGAFVDIGVHQDGLVHISQLADHFVEDPNQIVKVQDKVKVWVHDVDLKRKRIGLSLKGPKT